MIVLASYGDYFNFHLELTTGLLITAFWQQLSIFIGSIKGAKIRKFSPGCSVEQLVSIKFLHRRSLEQLISISIYVLPELRVF